ncbi:LysR family transcriptional regulator [Avibacterium sp. 20-15]|uniref:LysR family transcriptional regulator n=1 Tax=unclassified Avibacterium TaxID=2685287 RepID=UPI002026A84A|nr:MULTISPECIES: LysR family transcriptional regulator [unclassified Avibacterium]MCW9731977.1 LysR family transcriptional regulator [Avibacterium sp. 20-15]URL04164.1 LysR family transcriptional regulator [Avibacterium sp. 20-132]
MDKITAINVFLEAARTGSFTDTAEHLQMSRPMVSRHIALIERWLDARLFHRTTRHISLTEAGRQAVPYCQEILNQIKKMQDDTASGRLDLQGTLRLTASISFGATHLTEAIYRFQKQHPKLAIYLNLSEASLNLVEQGIDLAIRISSRPDGQLISRPLADCHSVLAATPAYLAEHGTPKTPEDLPKHRFLAHSHLNRTELSLEKAGEEKKCLLTNAFSANDAGALLCAVRHHAGIAMLPRYLVERELQSGELVALLGDWQLPVLKIYGLYASREHLPKATRLFLDFLIDDFANKDW